MVKRGFIAFLVFMLMSFSLGQSLKELAPADAILTLGLSSESEFVDSLKDDLGALDWSKVSHTVEQLALFVSEAGDFYELADLLDMMNELENQDEMMSELYAECPQAEALMADFEAFSGHVPFDALLSVGFSSFNPIPAVTAMMRIDESYAPLMDQTRDVLLECAASSGGMEISTLSQDDVTLYVLGDAGDFPVVIGSMDNLFFAGTNPDALRSIVRKMNGESENGFADTRMGQEMMRFDAAGNNMSFSLDFAQIADVAEGFAGFIIDGEETEYLVNRGLAMLRTLGGMAGQVTASPEGLVSEFMVTVNPEGGDAALADYILCDYCNVSTPFLAPSGAVSVSSAYIPWRELYAYAETWIRDIEAITGEQLDIRAILADEFGFDIDVALFDWLGAEVHSVVLEPLDTDLRTLLYNPAQFTFIPVSSPEAAEAGMAELTEVLPGLFDLMAELDGEMPSGLGGNVFDMIAVRPYDYKGREIKRVQMSLNSDFGVALVGNYLVIGSPVQAVEHAIDTFEGGRMMSGEALFMDARTRADVPANATTFSVSEDQSSMYGLANLLDLSVQPAAYFSALGLEAASYEDDYDYFFDDDFEYEAEPYYADLFGLEAEPFSPPGDTVGMIEETDIDNLGYYTDFYQLTDLNPGDMVTVQLGSEDFDSYIWLIDAVTSEYLDENDDSFDDFAISELSFTVEEGRDYWVEISSYDGETTGEYVLTVLIEEGMAMSDDTDMADTSVDDASMDDMTEEVEAPSFVELLEVFELLPESVRIIADHLSTSDSFSTIDGDTVYTRSVTRIRW